jgi:hypothetical protein
MKYLLFAAVLAQDPSRQEIVQTIDAFATLDRLSGGEGERRANESRFLKVRLKREANRIEEGLREALAEEVKR